MAQRFGHRVVLFTALLAGSGPGTMTAPAAPEGPARADHPREAVAAHPLPFFYDLYTFRGDTATAIVAAFAVEAGDLVKEDIEGGVRYRFDVSFILVDTLRRTVTNTHDSVYVEMPRALPHDHLLYTAVEVQAPPSRNTIQRVLMFNATSPGIGQLYTGVFPIPDYSGGDLMLSDIALGQPDAEIGWNRGDVTLALLPAGRFPSSAFDAYYEIYNLPTGHPYATEITVDRIDDGDASIARVVDVRFEGESSAARDAVLPERRRIETSLARGRYRMTATVTDLSTRQSSSRARTFEVHSLRGATMVPALNVASGQASRSGSIQR